MISTSTRSTLSRWYAIPTAVVMLSLSISIHAAQPNQEKPNEKCVANADNCADDGRAVSSDPSDGNIVPKKLQAVFVTARRRSENLQDVPLTEVVITPDTLRENNVQTLTDLQYRVPSLNLFTFSGDTTITLRGQGGYDPGAAPAVVTYFNEVPVPVTAGSNPGATMPGAFYDLQNVQVLYGPQGTLFGRNTTGGAVLYTTARPTNRFEGYVEGGIGNYGSRDVEFAVNLPLIDNKLQVRVAGKRTSRDGYTHVIATPNNPGGLDLDDVDNWSGRISVAFMPTDRIRNDTVYQAYESDTNGASGLFKYVAPDGIVPYLYPNADALVDQQLALGNRVQLPIGVDPFRKVSQDILVNITNIELTDTLSLRNVFGYYRSRTSTVFDGDGTALPIYDYPIAYPQPTERVQRTEELQLHGKTLAGNFNWVVGGFLTEQPKPHPDHVFYTVYGGTPYGATTSFSSVTSNESKAIYAHLISAHPQLGFARFETEAAHAGGTIGMRT